MLSAFKKIEKIADVGRTAETFAEAAKVAKIDALFKSVKFTTVNQKTLLNGVESGLFLKTLRLEGALKAFKVINVNIDAVKNELNAFDRLIKTTPEFKLNNALNSQTKHFKALENVKTIDQFNNLDKTTINKIENGIKSKAKTSTGGGKVIGGYSFVGLSVIGLSTYEILEAYQRRISGCLRYETIGDKTKICQIGKLSCNKKIIVTGTFIPECDQSELTVTQKNSNIDCVETNNKEGCNHCSSSESDPDSKNFIPETPPDNVHYMCMQPSLLEATNDLLHDVSDDILEAVEKSGVALGNSFDCLSNLPKYLIYILPIIILFILYNVFFNKRPERVEEKSFGIFT